MFKLVIEDDGGNRSVVPVIRDEITIGRQEGNTIRLTEQNVSRRHAKLIRDGKNLYLEDISARYGTKKNGKKITKRVALSDGDEVQIGDYFLRLQNDAKISATSETPTVKVVRDELEQPLRPPGSVDAPTERILAEDVDETLANLNRTDRMSTTDILENVADSIVQATKFNADEQESFDDEFDFDDVDLDMDLKDTLTEANPENKQTAHESSSSDHTSEDSVAPIDGSDVDNRTDDNDTDTDRRAISDDILDTAAASSDEDIEPVSLEIDFQSSPIIDTEPSVPINQLKTQPEIQHDASPAETDKTAKKQAINQDITTQKTEKIDTDAVPQKPIEPAKLVVLSGNIAGQTFSIKRRDSLVGRGDDCHIVIDHKSVSLHHAKIIRDENDRFKIIDLESKNGTKVNGEEYHSVHLNRGDIIELGYAKIRFVEPGENYVFTPEIKMDTTVMRPTNKPAKSQLPLIIVGLFALAAAVGVVAFFISSSQTIKTTDTPSITAAQSDTTAPMQDSERVQAALEKARGEHDEGNTERAIDTLNFALEFLEPSTPQQQELNVLIKQYSQQLAAHNESLDEEHPESILEQDGNAVAAAPTANNVPRTGTALRPTAATGKKTNFQQQIQAATAQELFNSAQRKLIQDDAHGAIEDCKTGLENGHNACHRVLGFAYIKLQDSKKACQHFQSYLQTNPSNTGDVLREMETIKCSPQ